MLEFLSCRYTSVLLYRKLTQPHQNFVSFNLYLVLVSIQNRCVICVNSHWIPINFHEFISSIFSLLKHKSLPRINRWSISYYYDRIKIHLLNRPTKSHHHDRCCNHHSWFGEEAPLPSLIEDVSILVAYPIISTL